MSFTRTWEPPTVVQTISRSVWFLIWLGTVACTVVVAVVTVVESGVRPHASAHAWVAAAAGRPTAQDAASRIGASNENATTLRRMVDDAVTIDAPSYRCGLVRCTVIPPWPVGDVCQPRRWPHAPFMTGLAGITGSRGLRWPRA